MDEILFEECDIKIEEEELNADFSSDDNGPNIDSAFIPNENHRQKSTNLLETRVKSKRLQGATTKLKKDGSTTETYSCPRCPFWTSWKCYLKNHIKKIHSAPGEVPIYHCMHCNFKTKWRFSLVNHMKTHSDPATLTMHKCPKCDYQTKWNNSLTGHMKVHLKPKVIKKVYNCTKCDFQTTNRDNLGEHVKVHEPAENMFKCPLCTFHTKFRHGVHLHLKVHNWRN